jgi:tripartite-type tricarboxylate transporter receptor subunit TctC
MQIKLRSAAVLLFALSTAGSVLAQQPSSGYPNRPVRLMTHFPPGGSTDIIARLISPLLAERLGKPVVVENRPGAGGIVASELTAKAPPDGHTLYMATASSLAHNPILFAKLPYDPVKDFAPLTLLVTSPFMVAVHPSNPVNSVRELITMVKAKPGQMAFASGGNASGMHLAGELFRILAGLEMIHVPYKGNGPALQDLAGGQVPIAFTDLGSTSALLKGGRIKILAVATRQRSPLAPDIPTAAESGLPGWEAFGWFGLVTTGGTPADIVNRLNAEVTSILRQADIRERILATGNEPGPMSVEEFRSFIRSEYVRWEKVIREARIKVD